MGRTAAPRCQIDARHAEADRADPRPEPLDYSWSAAARPTRRSALTVPSQCPHSALTVPSTVPSWSRVPKIVIWQSVNKETYEND